jgi:hypothetical protein
MTVRKRCVGERKLVWIQALFSIAIMSASQSAFFARHDVTPMLPWEERQADLAILASVWARCKSDCHTFT